MIKSGVYAIINLVNSKPYIGSTIDLEKRRKAHFSFFKKKKHFNIKLQRAVNKYGVKNFKFVIISFIPNTFDSLKQFEKQLRNKEQKYCDLWGFKNIYNLAKDTTAPMLGRKHSPEMLKDQSRRMSGKNNPMYGKSPSKRTRKLISLSGKGLKRSQETKDKIRKANLNKKLPDWVKKKISESRKGLKLSTAAIEANRESKRKYMKPVSIQNIKTGVIKHFESIKATARFLKTPQPHITKLRQGKRKSCLGWRLYE